MKLFIDYDPYLKKEAQITADITKKVFGFEVVVKAKQHPELLEYKDGLPCLERKQFKIEAALDIIRK